MMKRCLLFLGSALALSTMTPNLHAQALPAASRGGLLQGGLAVTSVTPDETTKRIAGITGYATFDLTERFGVEADLHFTTLNTPQDFGENSYLVGARYVYRKKRYEPYAKVLIGIGTTVNQGTNYQTIPNTPGSFFIWGGGGGLDIRFAHHINVRAIDFELQQWPGFTPHGLSPTAISIGVAYRLR